MVLRQIFPHFPIPYFFFCWNFLGALKHCRELHPYAAVQFLTFHFVGSHKKSEGDLIWGSSNENEMFSSKYSMLKTKLVVKCSVSFKMFSLGFEQYFFNTNILEGCDMSLRRKESSFLNAKISALLDI